MLIFFSTVDRKDQYQEKKIKVERTDPWTSVLFVSHPSLPFSTPLDQTVFAQCRPLQGVLERVCTCTPALPSMSGHVIIRMSYHFWVPGPLLVSLLLSLASFSLCHCTYVLTLALCLSLLHICLRWAASVCHICLCTACLNSPLRAMVSCSLCRAVFGCFWLASWQIRQERLEDVLRKKEGKKKSAFDFS